MRPWFVENPGCLSSELKALDDAGYDYKIDPNEQALGRIVLIVKYPIKDDIHDLQVVYPDFYPYFPLQIFATSFPDGPHKHPYNGLLCLLKDPQKNWSTEDTLASMLDTKVRDIAKAHLTPSEAEPIEAHEGSPATGYFTYHPNAVVLTAGWKIPDGIDRGYLLIGLESGAKSNEIVRGIVLEVLDERKNLLQEIDLILQKRYSHFPKIHARWVRLKTPPKSESDNTIFEEAGLIWPEILKPKFNNGPDIVGLIFPEEAQYKKPQENWIFIVRLKIKESPKKSIQIVNYHVRADRLSKENNYARVLRCSPIGNKKVFLVGLGAIGSICAWQLARTGIGHLHLLDFDYLQLGNFPRWLLGYTSNGFDKATCLQQYLNVQYPFVRVTSETYRLGEANIASPPMRDIEIIEQALEGTDLIVDATAEKCVSHFLSELAYTNGIPYIWATGTPGSWGGIVGRIIPGRTEGCWNCFQGHMLDKKIKTPNQENIPDIQPIGCFSPTFSGTGFDMDHISLTAVRLVISTLCIGNENAYPDFEWDVGVVDLWDEETKMPTAPKWTTYPLEKHPDCIHA